MADVVEVWCSSRAMAAVSAVQGFWKSRFLRTADRGYLHHLVENTKNQASIDWRRLYHLTAHCEHLGPHCQSRQKRWLRYEWIKDRYSMTHGFKEIPAPNGWGSKSATLRGDDGYMLSNYSASLKGWEIKISSWKNVQGIFRCDGRFCSPEHQFVIPGDDHLAILRQHAGPSQNILIKESLLKILVSVLNEAGNTFITGFELVYKCRPNEIFGYRLPGKQTAIDLRGRQLSALDFSVGYGGIHALRPCFKDGTSEIAARWIGLPTKDDSSPRIRFEIGPNLRAMRGEFDVGTFC
jgi:hypothetical protein